MGRTRDRTELQKKKTTKDIRERTFVYKVLVKDKKYPCLLFFGKKPIKGLHLLLIEQRE